MGFAASQARFLMLTARMSDVELETEQITQERLDLSQRMDEYTDDYSEAVNNQSLFASVKDPATGESTKVSLTYDVITASTEDGGLGRLLLTSSGLIVVSSEEEMQEMLNDPDNDYSESDFYIFKDVTNSSTLQRNLENGNFYFSAGKDTDGEWIMKGYEQLSTVSLEYDSSDDAAAKAEYTSQMRRAEAQDTLLEQRLNQLDSEHSAIDTELEAVQKVIDDNIEKSYGTFA